MHRHRLLARLDSVDVRTAWTMADLRRLAPKVEQQMVMRDFSVWDDLPEDGAEVITFEGRADTPAGLFSGFRKVLFTQPDNWEGLYGRLDLRCQYGAVADLVHPLYFKASVGPTSVQATLETADAQLEYLPAAQLCLSASELPDPSWPAPADPRPPFGGGLVDYLRAVAPGVYAGVGFKAPTRGLVVGRRFLHFLLVRRFDLDRLGDRPARCSPGAAAGAAAPMQDGDAQRVSYVVDDRDTDEYLA